MKRLRLITVACAFGLAGLALSGCGNVGDECSANADCESGQVCYQEGISNYCAANCTDDPSACGSSETCTSNVPNGKEGESYCVLNSDLGDTGFPDDAGVNDGGGNDDGGGGDGISGCESDGDCASHETCNTETNVCEPYRFVQIRDQTPSGTSACMSPSDNDPGADIIAASVENNNGDIVGWAQVLNDSIKGDPNDHSDPSVINGQPSNLGEDCVADGFSGEVVAMGCGGRLGIAFEKTDGSGYVELTENHSITVHEYGPQCSSSGSSEDDIAVTVCSHTAESNFSSEVNTTSNGSWEGCDNSVIASGNGKVAGPVSLP